MNNQIHGNGTKNLVCAISNSIGVNLQVYTTSNILISIQIVSTGIDVIRLAIAILTTQFVIN